MRSPKTLCWLWGEDADCRRLALSLGAREIYKSKAEMPLPRGARESAGDEFEDKLKIENLQKAIEMLNFKVFLQHRLFLNSSEGPTGRRGCDADQYQPPLVAVSSFVCLFVSFICLFLCFFVCLFALLSPRCCGEAAASNSSSGLRVRVEIRCGLRRPQQLAEERMLWLALAKAIPRCNV